MPYAQRHRRAVTVLAIDDEPSILRLLQRGLPHVGAFDVVTAQSSQEAVDVLGSGLLPEVVLLDHSVDAAEGLEDVLAELCPRPRVLYFTGQRLSEAQRARVDGVVYKPMSLQTLAAELVRERRELMLVDNA